MLSIVNEVDSLIFLLHIFCIRYKHVFLHQHGREILEFGSFHNSELGSLTPYIEEENDIDARLATLDQKLAVNSLRNLALESPKDDNKKMERGELECLP